MIQMKYALYIFFLLLLTHNVLNQDTMLFCVSCALQLPKWKSLAWGSETIDYSKLQVVNLLSFLSFILWLYDISLHKPNVISLFSGNWSFASWQRVEPIALTKPGNTVSTRYEKVRWRIRKDNMKAAEFTKL